ncbi:MAG: recombinase family protein [Phycisphaeraceae bacterium]
MPRAAIGYIRVSTQEQAREGVSLEAQTGRIESHCSAQGLDLIACHEDRGISGRKASNRHGLEAAIEDVTARKGVLVVYSLSRLARSVRDCIDIAARLEKAGAELALLSENIETISPAGRMFFHVLAALAQFESDLNGERVRTALDYTRQQGRAYCRNAPYGYRFEDGRIVTDEGEQAVVRKIRQLRGKGWAFRKIQQKLEREGVRNRHGKPLAFQAIAVISKQVQEGAIHRPERKRRRGQ